MGNDREGGEEVMKGNAHETSPIVIVQTMLPETPFTGYEVKGLILNRV